MNFKISRRERIEPVQKPATFDVSPLTLEDEIADALLASRPVAPPPAPLSNIGDVTAEAVMLQYEAAAKTIEDMRQPMKDWTDYCRTALADLEAAMKYIEETAQRFREIGKNTHDQIQRSSVAISEVRQTCDDIRAKIDPRAAKDPTP